MRRLSAGIGLVMVLLAAAPSGAFAADAHRLTRIVSPRLDQVVTHGRAHVVLRSRASLASLSVNVDGRDVRRYFHRSGHTYRALLRRGRGLHAGVNQLVVSTRGGVDFDRVRFIVARHAPQLLTLSDVRVGGAEAPVRVVAKAAPHSTLHALLNGHRVDGAFQPEGHVYIGRLGANDSVRPGRNRLVVLVERAARSGRSALDDVETKTFRRKRGQLIAGAGPDRVVSAGTIIELEGSAVQSGSDDSGTPTVEHRWEVVDRESGPAPVLQDAATATPEFLATTPGHYTVKTTVSVGAPTSSGAAASTASSDTVSIAVRADAPPIGWRLDTTDEQGTIRLNGAPIPGTTQQCCPSASFESYAVFDRQTLELVDRGSRPADAAGLKFLADLAAKYNASPTYLMVVNLSGLFAQPPDATRLFDTLGVAKFSGTFTNIPRLISIVGVPGSPAGSAFVSEHSFDCVGCFPRPLQQSNMSGYVRLNPLSATGGHFEFVFADQQEFDTDANPDPAQIAVRVGDQSYTHSAPTDGSAGFFLVRLASQTLAPIDNQFYVTNRPDGSPDPAATARLAADLGRATAGPYSRGGMLVVLQAFGAPKGNNPGTGNTAGWQQAAAAIERLGGNAQVFAQQNRGFGVSPGRGPYAFVGRSAMDGPAAEASQSLTPRSEGKLHGLIGRGRDDQYLPLVADPAGTVNFDLVRIVNRPPVPGGGFPALSAGQAAAAEYLGRDPDVIGVCAASAPTCDVRKAYYDRYAGTNWGTILTRLGNDVGRAKCANGGPGFTKEECDEVRTELQIEIGRRNTVEEYFGPKGLQAPFGTAQVAAVVDVASIAEEIRAAVKPPAADNAVAHALNIVTFITKIAGASGAVCPPCGAVAGGLGGVFGLAAYLTTQDGTPDVVGPQVTAQAAKLGGTLFDRYQRVSSYLTTEAKIIMSDWTKMSEVAASATNEWALGDIATSKETIRLATRQAIYQALVPVAYPVLYDLGAGVAHATDWKCISPSIFLYDKNLFQQTGLTAELPYMMTSPPYENHLFAVGGPHTVGSLHSAYVPAPPDSLTGTLFRDPAAPPAGGIGFSRLSFYSPQNFRVFGQVLQQTLPPNGTYGYQTCQSMPNPPDNAG